MEWPCPSSGQALKPKARLASQPWGTCSQPRPCDFMTGMVSLSHEPHDHELPSSDQRLSAARDNTDKPPRVQTPTEPCLCNWSPDRKVSNHGDSFGFQPSGEGLWEKTVVDEDGYGEGGSVPLGSAEWP